MTFSFCHPVKRSLHWHSNTIMLTFVSLIQFLFMPVTSTGSANKKEKKLIKRKNHNLIQIVRQCKPLEMFVPAMVAFFLFIFNSSASVFYFFPRFFYSSV